MAQRVSVWNLLRGHRYVPLSHSGGTPDGVRTSTATDRDDREQQQQNRMACIAALWPAVNVFSQTGGVYPTLSLQEPHVRPFPRTIHERDAFNLDELSKFANNFSFTVNHKPHTHEASVQTQAPPKDEKLEELTAVYERELGLEFLEMDMAKDAIVYLQKASDAGDGTATAALADCHYNGRGTSVDHVKAAELWERAARGGHVESMYQRAVCVLRGIGLTEEAKRTRDEEKARENGLCLMEDAAAKGSPHAAYYMAVHKIRHGDFEDSRSYVRVAARDEKFHEKFEDWLEDKSLKKEVKSIVRQVFKEMNPDAYLPNED